MSQSRPGTPAKLEDHNPEPAILEPRTNTSGSPWGPTIPKGLGATPSPRKAYHKAYHFIMS